MAFVRVEHASVIFSIYGTSARSVRARFLAATSGGRIGTNAKEHVTVQALDDIMITLNHGDRIALVGHNGAGKTTLLRLIAGIYEPTSGRVFAQGKVAPIFDVAGGMDGDSTGYENITLRGLYLGLSKAEIRAKREEVADFSGLGPFLDMPLRTYSAGMQARLAFAISTSIEPEILLLDEAVGTGDAAFLKKAGSRLDELVKRSGILVFASHVERTIRATCTSAILLERGRIKAIGSIDEVLWHYSQGLGRTTETSARANTKSQ